MISTNQMYYIVRLMFFMIIIFYIYSVINNHMKEEVDIFEVESSIVRQRFLNDNGSFCYTDTVTGRFYPGIIDINKFNQDFYDSQISKEIYIDNENPYLSGNITLKDINGNYMDSITFNEKQYSIYAPLAKAGYVKGKGGVRKNTKIIYVLIKEEDQTSTGFLEMEVVSLNG